MDATDANAPTPRSTLASRVSASEPQMNEKSATHIINSLRDRVYQRSFNLRKTFIELDPNGNGLVPIDVFAGEMTRFFSLSPIEQKALRVLLDESDFRRDGKIDFREFCEMLKMRDYASDAVVSDAHRRRLQNAGVLDPRMQRMIRDGTRPIHVTGGVPTNELGHMTIECPFGVLGDSERMDAVISAFLSHKAGQINECFAKHDGDRDGWLTRVEFRAAMKDLDKYVFDDEIDALLESIVDNHGNTPKGSPRTGKHANHINIAAFVNGPGREYLKKKAHRSNAHASPFVWDVPTAPPRTASSSRRGPRGTLNASGSPRSGQNRAAALRTEGARARLEELKRDDPFFAQSLEKRRLAAQGTAIAVPAPPSGSHSPSTPRLPAIASARR